MVQLIELLAEKNLVRLLVFSLQHPTTELSQVEIRKRVKMARTTLIKWLAYFVKQDIILLKKVGPTNLYSLNREDSFVKQLKILQNLSLLINLKKTLSKHNVKLYLYGSAARGEDTENSDLDILVIGRVKKEEIIGEINKLSAGINRKISSVIFSDLQWSEMARKDKAFYERVEKDKVEL